MPALSIAHLSDRTLIRVSGEEAHHFLQNLITADLEDVDRTGAGFAALLTPQGKILFDFLIYSKDGAYLIDAHSSTAADLVKRLTFYRLRAQVDLELVTDGTGVLAVWGGETEAPDAIVSVTDPRLPALGQRIAGPVNALLASIQAEYAGPDAYDLHRIGLGVPQGLQDYEYSSIFPHDADLDQLGGISFLKGCYVGQEVVSRVHHRGTARKRFLMVKSTDKLPEMGTRITLDGKSIGTLGSSTSADGNYIGLGLLRLDKVSQAKENGSPLQCGDTFITVSIPEWAEFTLPEADTAD